MIKMNYGIMLLGASLVIVHFLRLVGAMGGGVGASVLASRKIQELVHEKYLRTVLGEDDTVLGWLLGDHMLKRRSLLEEVWSSSSELSRTIFYQRQEPASIYDDDGTLSEIIPTITLSNFNSNNNNDSESDRRNFNNFYSSFWQWWRVKYGQKRINVTECLRSHNNYNSYNNNNNAQGGSVSDKKGNETESPHHQNGIITVVLNNNITAEEVVEEVGCRYIVEEKVLVCDNANLTSLPKLPDELELFELNQTTVQVLGENAFGTTRITTVKIHANSLSCIHPLAFQGLSGLKILSISNNALSYIRMSDFKSLNETFILYLEHNNIDLSHNPYDDDDDDSDSYANEYDDKNPNDTNRTTAGVGVDVDKLEPALPSLIYFSLMGNPLQVIPPRFFFPLRYSPVQTLCLMCCKLRYIDPEALTYLPYLSKLDLSENPELMTNLTLAFSGLNNSDLTDLNLANNNLVQLPTTALQQFPRLEILDLHGNLFDALHKDSFPPNLKSLKSLNLDNCRIRSIAQFTFKEMAQLETLILTNNRLSSIPAAVTYLVNLRALELSGNVPAAISTINPTKGVFKINPFVLFNQSQLKYLTLSNLPLTHIDMYSLRGLRKLEILLMSNTNIEYVTEHAMEDLINLRILDLSHGELKQINSNTFKGLGNLTTLLLNYNQLEIQAPDNEFIGDACYPKPRKSNRNPQLVNLNHDEGDEEGSKTEPFQHLKKLERLTLNYNNIRYIHKTLFQHQKELTHLDLSENLIHSWEERVFVNNSKLQDLLLYKNLLGPISRAMLDDFLAKSNGISSTEILDISNNPFVCDKNSCELSKLAHNGSLSLNKWGEKSEHTCFDTLLIKYQNMQGLNSSNELCVKIEAPPTTTTTTTTTTSPTTTTTTTTKTTTISSSSSSTDRARTTVEEEHVDFRSTTKAVEEQDEETAPVVQFSSSPPPPTPIVTEKTSNNGSDVNNNNPVQTVISSTMLTTFAIVILCLFFLSSATIIGYRKRFHLKYIWFVVRFNVVNVPNLNLNKKRASITSYEFDIFISYNHTDREFIEDHLVPRVESFPNPYLDLEMNNNNSSIVRNNFNSGDNISDSFSETNSGKYRGLSEDFEKYEDNNNISDDVESVKSESSSSSTSSHSSSNSLRVCIHERDFKAGVPISDNIVNFVDRSRKVVVVVSKNYLESQWCMYEMNLAYHRMIESGRKSFLVILLEDIPSNLRTKSLNYLLLSRTYLEWPGLKAKASEQNTFWKKLKKSLSSPD